MADVFFANNKFQIKQAFELRQHYPRRNICILTPSLSGQFELLRHQHKHAELYDLIYNKKYYQQTLLRLYKQSRSLAKNISESLPKFICCDINLSDVLQVLFEAEVLDVLAASNLYENITAKLEPERYLFPTNMEYMGATWVDHSFGLASLLKEYFVPKSKIQLYKTKNGSNRDQILKSFKKNSSQLFTSFIKGVRIKLRRKIDKPYNKINKVDFLLFSGGLNLIFYKRMIDLLNLENTLNYKIITSKQSYTEVIMLNNSQIEYAELDNLLNQEAKNKIDSEIARFGQYITNIEQNKNHIVPVREVSGIVSDAAVSQYLKALLKYGPKFIKQTILAQKALHDHKPKLMITTHDPGPSALPFVYLSKKLHIQSIVLLHGLHDIHFGADFKSDYTIAWGSYWKKAFKSVNKKPKQILLGGFPYLDSIFQSIGKLQTFKTVQTKKNIVIGFLLTVYAIDICAINKFLLDVLLGAKVYGDKFELWLRVHPGQNIEDLSQIAQALGVRVVLNGPADLGDFIKSVDVVVSWDTTAIIWSCIYNKPTFYTTPWWGVGHIPLRPYKPAWLLTNAKSLFQYCSDIESHKQAFARLIKQQSSFLEYIVGYQRGNASERHIEILKQLLK